MTGVIGGGGGVSGGIPIGGIIIWSGAIANIPSGWHICDGTEGTPDLTDRFVLHADADSDGTNNVGDTGGEKTHTLTINEMPSHTHNVPWGTSGGSSTLSPTGGKQGDVVTSSVGGGNAHNNRDKYYALAYIMKVS